MPHARLPGAEKALFGVTSSKEADAGAVGLLPDGGGAAAATGVAKVMAAALADLGRASDDFMTDEDDTPEA